MSKNPKVLVVNVTGAKVDELGNLVDPDNIKFEQTFVRLQELPSVERESIERALGWQSKKRR